jgi:excisionase family DNA binding protein
MAGRTPTLKWSRGMLTTGQAKVMLRCGSSTVYKLAAQGGLRCWRTPAIGRKGDRRFPAEDVVALAVSLGIRTEEEAARVLAELRSGPGGVPKEGTCSPTPASSSGGAAASSAGTAPPA